MTRNLWSEERDLICLNCARGIVTPRRSGLKYGSLNEYLGRRGQFTSLLTLSFSKIEGIINDNLPFSALRDASWWSNSQATPQGHAWTGAGWSVQSVDVTARRVRFKKNRQDGLEPSRKKRRKAQQPFTPVPVKPRKTRRPSKTRVARAVARARNIERRRATAPYTIRSKHKSAYEKRLYKPEAKPSSQD
ncbi:MAG: hypothetical protein NWE81_01015 [Candidatus Bathyarchaeota archaeon]|jgi:hypothetical protein|nr:hypothetical protein [Candidatus Bathyarchaeota archaeon]